MHFKKITILTLTTLLSCSSTTFLAHAHAHAHAHAQATGNATVTNKGTSPIYLWSVGASISPQHTLNPDETYTESFHHDPLSGGIAIKLTRTENGLYHGCPQLTYAYTLDEGTNTVWYDLSDVYGDPFSGGPVLLVPFDESCAGVRWPNGVPVGGGGGGGGSSVKSCFAGGDVGLSVGGFTIAK